MSIQLSHYRNQSFESLVQQAQSNGFDNAGQLSHAELIFELVCADVQAQQHGSKDKIEIVAEGLLEILSDGFGFLRSPVSDFAAGADDSYVSPAQIRRFNLRSGDWIKGVVRIPRDNERYFALLRIESVNARSPEAEKKRLNFAAQSLDTEKQSCTLTELTGLSLGESVFVKLNARQHPATLIFPLLQKLDSVVLTLLNYPLEDAAVLKRAWPEGVASGRLLFSTRGSDSQRHLQVLGMGQQRAHRLVEQFQDVHWVVATANEIAVATQYAMEQHGRVGTESMGVEAVCAVLAQARNLQTTGSLTVWMCGQEERSTFEDAVLQRVSYESHHQCVVSSEDGALEAL